MQILNFYLERILTRTEIINSIKNHFSIEPKNIAYVHEINLEENNDHSVIRFDFEKYQGQFCFGLDIYVKKELIKNKSDYLEISFAEFVSKEFKVSLIITSNSNTSLTEWILLSSNSKKFLVEESKKSGYYADQDDFVELD